MKTRTKIFTFIFLLLTALLCVSANAQPGVAAPSSPEYVAGFKAYSEARYQDAVLEYTKHLKKFPADANALLNRGLAYQALQKNDEAIADFSKAIVIDPKSAKPLRARGSRYGRMITLDVKKYLRFSVAHLPQKRSIWIRRLILVTVCVAGRTSERFEMPRLFPI